MEWLRAAFALGRGRGRRTRSSEGLRTGRNGAAMVLAGFGVRLDNGRAETEVDVTEMS